MKKLRFLSIVLVLSMLFSFSAYAISHEEESQAVSADLTPADTQDQGLTNENIDNVTLGVGELTLEQLGLLSVEDTELHEKIDIDTAKQKGHVNRLYEQENDLHTIIYQNKDGSKTSYIFANPVKYVDSEGNVRDKSTKITASSDSKYLYAMEDNNVKAYFSKTVNDGIALTAAGYKIAMKPKGTALGGAATYASDSNSVSYLSPFGNGTSLIYRTTFSGIKEDIVLSSYTGANTFEFDLGVTGLTPQKTNGVWTLVNDKDEVIATFSEIITKDANGKMIVGTLDITATNGGYKMTVTVPEAYLTSPGTVYPVYIDPTVDILEVNVLDTSTSSSGMVTIVDVNMYSTSLDNVPTTYGSHELGGTNPEGRLIVKLPEFYRNSENNYTALKPYQIGKVTLNMYVSEGSGAVITSRALGDTWDLETYGEDPDYLGYISTVWNSCGSDDEYPVINTTINQPGYNEFDITQYVKNWAYVNTQGVYDSCWDAQNGIIFSSSTACLIDSTDMSTNNNDMYVTMDYATIGGGYYVHNLSVNKILNNNSGTLNFTTFTGATSNKWYISYLGDSKYKIYSASTGKLLGASGTSVVFCNYTENPEIAYQWNIELLTGSGLRITNVSNSRVLYGSSTGVTLSLNSGTALAKWGILLCDEYVPMTNFTWDDTWIDPNTSKFFDTIITPSNASWQDDSYFTLSVSDSDIISASIYNFGLLTANSSGIVIVTVTHELTGVQKQFHIKTGIIPEGKYVFCNNETGRYLDIQNSSTSSGAYINQWDFRAGAQQQWELTLSYDGGYLIKSIHSGKYLNVVDYTIDGSQIIQTTAANCSWNIQETSSGAYRIVSPQGYKLALPEGTNAQGSLVIQRSDTNDADYSDEWDLYHCLYSLEVKHYYDQGFAIRYGGIESTPEALIESYQNDVAERYLKIFKLVVYPEYLPYTSQADQCKISTYGTVKSSNISKPCSHSSDHLTCNVLNQNINNGTSTTSIVIWTGHVLTGNPVSNAIQNDFTVILTTYTTTYNYTYINYFENEVKHNHTFDLIHELSHLFRIADHYCIKGYTTYDENNVECSNAWCDICANHYNGIRPNCVMGQRNDIKTLSDGVLFCSECITGISSHLADHH